jgi:hypothetical protein
MNLTKWEAKWDGSWKESNKRKYKMEPKLVREAEMGRGRGKWK